MNMEGTRTGATVLGLALAIGFAGLPGVGVCEVPGLAGSGGGAREDRAASRGGRTPRRDAPEDRRLHEDVFRRATRRHSASPSVHPDAYVRIAAPASRRAETDSLIASMAARRRADPLEGPEWDPNHDMRGVLYDEEGREIRRLGRESSRHRRDREARERAERERREREARERAERERREREARERAERERRERAERERAERERRARAEQEERERRARAEQEERERRARAEQEERERRARAEQEERDRRRAGRTPTREEQLAAAAGPRPDGRRQSELDERRRVDSAFQRYEEESRRYRHSGAPAPGYSGIDHPAATVGETALEAASPGPIPSSTVNAVGELNRVAPVLDARRRLIEELSR
jgi:hypothetical protein